MRRIVYAMLRFRSSGALFVSVITRALIGLAMVSLPAVAQVPSVPDTPTAMFQAACARGAGARSVADRLVLARMLRRAGYPRMALAIYSSAPADSLTPRQWLGYALAADYAGDIATERSVGRDAVRRFPGALYAQVANGQAAASSRDTAEAERVAAEIVVRERDEDGLSPAEGALIIRDALLAAGAPTAARRVARLAVRWREGRPDSVRGRVAERFEYGRALYRADDLTRADSVFATLAAPGAEPFAERFAALQYRGWIAARRGRRRAARQFADEVRRAIRALPASAMPADSGALGLAVQAGLLRDYGEAERLVERAVATVGPNEAWLWVTENIGLMPLQRNPRVMHLIAPERDGARPDRPRCE